jgi:hypothetical protein
MSIQTPMVVELFYVWQLRHQSSYFSQLPLFLL